MISEELVQVIANLLFIYLFIDMLVVLQKYINILKYT